MANYIVNLERIIALNVTVDVDDPYDAVGKAKELFESDGIDWDDAHVDQTAACCLATGDSSFIVISQKTDDNQ